MAIARSTINHPVRFDVANLVGAAVGRQTNRARPGSDVRRFEEAFADHLGVGECVAFPFARSAFHAALQALDVQPGAEVVLPPITIPPMVDAVVALGFRPIFVDIDPMTLIVDVDQLRTVVTDRTGAVMVTYLFGIASDPTAVIDLCRAAGVPVIEDFSHNLDATVGGRSLGTFGDLGIYSSSATKTLDAYGGGLAVTNDAELARRLRVVQAAQVVPPRRRLLAKVAATLVWNVASTKLVWTIGTFPLIRFLRWRHPEVERTISGARRPPADRTGPVAAWRERFTDLQARAGLRLLPQVGAVDAIRVANAEKIRTALRAAGITVPSGSEGGHHVHWQCIGYVADVERVQRALATRGIDVATTNLPLLCGCHGGRCEHPVATVVRNHALYFPCHPGVARSDLHRVVMAIADAQLAPVSEPIEGAG